MKYLLALSLMITTIAHAESIKLEEFDQLKLADLLSRLPLTVRSKEISNGEGDKKVQKVKSIFPKRKAAWRVECESVYYNGAELPTTATCQLEVDSHHSDLEIGYDQFRILVKNTQLTSALFNTISMGVPLKEFRSYGREKGLNFEGKQTNVFRYYFQCSVDKCGLFFSKLAAE